jgi:hypothetical protein
MSLRAEIHDAFDEGMPPALDLEFRVTRLLLEPARGEKVVLRRDSRARWAKPFRSVVTLVAAALVVVLIGSLIVGVRIWRDLQNQPQTISRINQVELKSLESRALRFPVVQPGDTCPASPSTDVSAHTPIAYVFGVGPVYTAPLASSSSRTDWGTWTELALVVDTKVSGPILIRGQDLQTSDKIVFARYPLHAIDDPGDGIPAGRVIGNQVVEGENEQLYPELVIDTSRHWVGTKNGNWPIYKSFMGYPQAAKGCLGFQIDGLNFTEWVIVSAG